MLGFPVKKDFKKIYVIQSYPTLMHLITFLAAEDDGVAVIVSLDGKIYRFLKNYFSGSKVLQLLESGFFSQYALAFLQTFS